MLEAAKSSLQDKDAVIRYFENRPAVQTKLKKLRSESLPHPNPFTGSDKSKYDDWKTTMRIKLNINVDHFPTRKEKIAYVRSRVKDLAARQLRARFQVNSPIAYTTIEEIFTDMDKYYDDPNRIQNLWKDFAKLRQKDDFQSFYAEWDRITIELPMTEETKLNKFRSKLSTELQAALVTVIDCQTVEELARKCSIFCNNIQIVNQERDSQLRRRERKKRIMKAIKNLI